MRSAVRGGVRGGSRSDGRGRGVARRKRVNVWEAITEGVCDGSVG
jgi:hypothetical protein